VAREDGDELFSGSEQSLPSIAGKYQLSRSEARLSCLSARVSRHQESKRSDRDC
jgi:hypothetical protein